jgi:hypothetical protein
MHIEIRPGDSIWAGAEMLVANAFNYQTEVTADFNGCKLRAGPGDTVRSVVDQFDQHQGRQAERERQRVRLTVVDRAVLERLKLFGNRLSGAGYSMALREAYATGRTGARHHYEAEALFLADLQRALQAAEASQGWADRCVEMASLQPMPVILKSDAIRAMLDGEVILSPAKDPT